MYKSWNVEIKISENLILKLQRSRSQELSEETATLYLVNTGRSKRRQNYGGNHF
jgi:hypothetical protein